MTQLQDLEAWVYHSLKPRVTLHDLVIHRNEVDIDLIACWSAWTGASLTQYYIYNPFLGETVEKASPLQYEN